MGNCIRDTTTFCPKHVARAVSAWVKTMKLIYVKKTASQQEQNEIVESLNAGREPSANVHSVEIMTIHQSDTVPDADGDYALLGLLNETDPKRKMQLLYRR